MFGLNRRLAIALGTAALLAVTVLGTVALADDPAPTATPGSGATTTQATDYKQVFLGKLAAALGISQADLEAKLKEAATATVDQAVADGNLARNTADALKERIAQGGSGLFGLHGIGGPGMGIERAARGVGPIVDSDTIRQAIADKLGLSVADLNTQLRTKSLADLAKEKNVAVADLYSAAAAAVKPQLDQAVKDGKITQAHADAMLESIESGRMVMGGHVGERHGMMGRR